MPSSGPTIRERYAADLRSGSIAVLVTAIPVAMAVGIGIGWYVHESSVGFPLLLLIGVLIPYAHESHWPQDCTWQRDVAWTVLASAATAVVYLGLYLSTSTVLAEPVYAASVSFLLTIVAGGGLIAVRRR